MTRLKITYPKKVGEFRVHFRGQHVCQDPIIQISPVDHRAMTYHNQTVQAAGYTHELFASYDPHVGGGYDPHVWFLRMPRGIKMPAMRAIMRDISPAVIAMIDAHLQTNLYVLVTAAEHLTDTVNIAIRDYVSKGY